MVRFTVLASGSKGNSSVLTCGPNPGGAGNSESTTRILIDAGLSCRELFRRMALVGEDPRTLDAILITHEHEDHIHGLAVTARKLGIPVYITGGTYQAWLRQVNPQKRISYAQWAEQYRREKAATGSPRGQSHPDTPVESDDPGGEGFVKGHDFSRAANATEENGASALAAVAEPESDCAAESPAAPPDPARLPEVKFFRAGQPFSIGGLSISPFTIPHDAADPVGFVFTAEGVRVAVATDLGYMPPNVQAQLRRCDLIMLESNHDLEMLRDGPYPWSVKQRVLSRVGHLSNDATADFLEGTYDGNATYLILAHLSESNNLPELARLAAERALCGKPSLLANRLLLASQHEPLDSVCF